MLNLKISDSFNKELPADKKLENSIRQVEGACFSYVKPKKPKSPSLVHVSDAVAKMLGLSEEETKSKSFLDISQADRYPQTWRHST